MGIIKIGSVIISKQISIEGRPVGYFYREEPDNTKDSGWRFFSGNEDQDYADNAENFDKFNASKIIEINPKIRELLGTDFPAIFELLDGKFVMVNSD